ncbi:divalent cation transporter [Pseudomaricurvus alcaniphilus]|uniref:ZIP family metal transporter n=1 Tax=Pseudomaricurvus alcaniphilus TaxID=1166482 RepID=UPI0014090010|nr:divalent cation transporter [Pseudomaricurvus alcaniphilus]NHN38514.1 divalent cation transporter [Pseudomaricurvus alcaniphilus]
MSELTAIVLYTLGAGACIPLGGLLANFEKIRPAWLENEFRHAVIAFGGGILVAAVALVLVPEGTHYVGSPLWSVLLFALGGAGFFGMERFLGGRRRESPQFTAMLLDYVPESLALGGAFALGSKSAPLLALFIGLQNLPEGFNAFRELRAGQKSSRGRILLFMLLLVPVGPLVGVLGWAYVSHYEPLLGAVMLLASGGILYLIFQDIAPQAHMQRHWAPPLGAVLGFCLGMLGNNLLLAAA